MIVSSRAKRRVVAALPKKNPVDLPKTRAIVKKTIPKTKASGIDNKFMIRMRLVFSAIFQYNASA